MRQAYKFPVYGDFLLERRGVDRLAGWFGMGEKRLETIVPVSMKCNCSTLIKPTETSFTFFL